MSNYKSRWLTKYFKKFILLAIPMGTIETASEQRPAPEIQTKILLARFFESVEFKSRIKPISQYYYRTDLNDWQVFLSSQCEPINPENITHHTNQYFDHLKEIGRKPATIARRRIAINKFGNWAAASKRKFLSEDQFKALDIIRVDKRVRKTINQAALSKLRGSVAGDSRKASIIELLTNGMRPSQISALKCQDVSEGVNGDLTVMVNETRPNQPKELILSGYSADTLRRYLLEKPKDPNTPLLPKIRRTKKESLSRQAIWISVKPALNKVGIESPEHLRIAARILLRPKGPNLQKPIKS